jgi:aminoglycoside N3'-acetyltransferase
LDKLTFFSANTPPFNPTKTQTENTGVVAQFVVCDTLEVSTGMALGL